MRAAGLLLLRMAVLVSLVPATLAASGSMAVMLWADAVLLAAGLLTPAAALVAAAHSALLLWRDPDGTALQAMLAALSLMLAGAGRLSLDAWVFGPRLVMAWPEPWQ
jgi:hypothetical protein